jgi:hypothetical protein
MQLYFLSVTANLLAGAVLASDYLVGRYPALEPLRMLFERRAARLTLAVITALVGVLKLFVYTNYADAGQVALLADLLPALAGIVAGATLAGQALEFGTERADEAAPPESETAPMVDTDGTVEKASRFAQRNRVVVGFAGIGAAVLHFLFGGVVLF